MTKPLMLLDVDGVLNAFGDYFAPIPDCKLERVFMANGASTREIASGQDRFYQIKVPWGTTKRLHYLDKLYDGVWCTTWEHTAIRELAPEFGVGHDWPVIEVGRAGKILPDGRFAQTWKLPEVWKWCEEHAQGRKVAWVDDDLFEDAKDWALERDYLMVETLYSFGMRKEDVRKLREYACG